MDPAKRLTVDQLMDHPWVRGSTAVADNNLNSMLEHIVRAISLRCAALWAVWLQ